MNRYKVLIAIISAFCLLLPTILFSQVDTAWVRRYNGPGNSEDYARTIALDSQNNIYVTGYSYGLGTSPDYATIKYNSAGVEQWVKIYNGPGNYWDEAYSIAVDGQGNVIVTGESYGSGTYSDFATIKYNSNGDTVWMRRYNGSYNSDDYAYATVVDGQNNVYVTGYSISSDTSADYTTIKYNSIGQEQWVARYSDPENDWNIPCAIVVDNSGNVYVTGTSGYNSSSFCNTDYLTIKYNSAGVAQWTARYNGTGDTVDYATGIVVDNQGGVYVTGGSADANVYSDFATIKYNSNGDTLWVRRYNGPLGWSDAAYTIALDALNNIIVSGPSWSSSGIDYATIKYNPAGAEQWVARYSGPVMGGNYVYGIAIDGLNNIYITGGGYGGTVTQWDCVTVKYNSAGAQQWVARYDRPGDDEECANAIALDSSDNVYITGYSIDASNNYSFLTIKYVQTQGVEEDEIASLPLAMTKSIEVYPNPAKTYFTVRLPLSAERSKIKIFDVNGNVVKSEELKGKNNRVSLDGIKNGVYFIQAGDEIINKKLVITK